MRRWGFPAGRRQICAVINAISFIFQTTLADTIILSDGSKLSGTIDSLDQSHLILASPLARTRLEVKTNSISRISLPQKAGGKLIHAERITLCNGDVLPCTVLSMDENELTISTSYTGELSLPRANVRSLRLDSPEGRLIHSAGDELSEWPNRKGHWIETKQGYVCKGEGKLGRQFDFPQDVCFKFDLSWESDPDFAFRFCDEGNDPETQDAHELVVNSSGLRLRSGKIDSWLTAKLPTRPGTAIPQSIDIEMHVRRTEDKIALFIDGNAVGTYTGDGSVTRGNYVTLENRSSNGSRCTIGNFRVYDLNETQSFLRRVDQSDVIVDSLGEEISGTIMSIIKAPPGNAVVIFSLSPGTEPLHIPERRIRTLFFANQKDGRQFFDVDFTVALKGRASIQLNKLSLIDGRATGVNPILGNCSFDMGELVFITKDSTR